MDPRPLCGIPGGSRFAIFLALALTSLAALPGFAAHPLAAQTLRAAGALEEAPVDPSLHQALRYRLIGPFRASRTVGGVGVPTRPSVFYMGVNNGGVWKTDDYGRTWSPLFDRESTGSIGDLAVSPSHPDVLYVGTGEGLHRPDLSVGDGIFKSTDGGATWRHVGLADVQQVGRLVVHPTDPDVVMVAGMGHPYGPNEERGVFRTTDGGATWEKVLYVDHNTGANQVEIHPARPSLMFAALWEHREGPWENGSFSGSSGGLFRSTDGGDTWRRLGGGLPGAGEGVGRISFALAPSDPDRVYALVAARRAGGVYRSDNGGDSWALVSTQRRLTVEIRVHPDDADVVFVGHRGAYRSEDGGSTWVAFKGSPGGDDYQRIWINPLHPDIMLFTSDQGAEVTVNGGQSWSSRYNQPTAQLYHVTTDDRFPYRVYGGQQESGALGIASRGNGGQISLRDWIGVGADEYAYVAPDPLDPDIVYGGRVMRFDRRTGAAQNVAPEALRSGKYRILRTMPLLFHPADPHTLLFATNVLWKTTTGGQSWEIVSPDLSRERPEVPPNVGDYRTPDLADMPRRGVIYAVAPSPLDVDVIWAGTDDGLIHVTRDGGATWRDVTPPALRAWDKVSQLDAGHFGDATAFAAINAMRRDDMRPLVYRTHDGGASWTLVTSGLPEMGPVNVVREDPKQPGLLFAGTEREVYFSIDDGDHWQSLRMNMPASSVRDLVVKDDDLVVGTHGRSIWIMDGISPLRELAAAAQADGPFLFTPPRATRVRDNVFADTPLHPGEPLGENPPDGAILDYWLPRGAGRVTLEVLDAEGAVVRRYASDEAVVLPDTVSWYYPTYWMRPPAEPSTEPGHHRLVWDLRWTPPAGTQRDLSIAATYRNTPLQPHGPLVHPGRYTVRLSVDGATSERPLDVRLDPRATLSAQDLRLQTDLSMAAYRAYLRAQALREQIERVLAGGSAAARDDGAERVRDAETLRGQGEPGLQDVLYGSITAVPSGEETVVGLQNKLLFLLEVLQGADARPTPQAAEAVASLEAVVPALERRWEAITSRIP